MLLYTLDITVLQSMLCYQTFLTRLHSAVVLTWSISPVHRGLPTIDPHWHSENLPGPSPYVLLQTQTMSNSESAQAAETERPSPLVQCPHSLPVFKEVSSHFHVPSQKSNRHSKPAGPCLPAFPKISYFFQI